MTWSPPIIPARRHDWEPHFVAIMERHRAMPFVWGKSDCLIVPADLARAMTGVDPMRSLRAYRTEAGAARLLARLGFADVEEALKAVFPRIPKAWARRGDAGVIEQVVDGRRQLATLIVVGTLAIGKAADGGHVAVPRSALRATYAIGEP